MSESPPVIPAPAGEALTYRPLSGLAIASLALSGLFTLLVAVGAVVGFFQSGPVFWPGWVLLVPAAGAVLAVLAQWRIHRAEGTQAGAALARWGGWLAVLSGLGYGAYYFATSLAIQQQANHFLLTEGEDSGFFPRLEKGDPGDVNRAFLLTLPPGRRLGASPDDKVKMTREFDALAVRGGPGQLSWFRDSDVVQTVLQAGREKESVQALGARSWEYEGGRQYRVECDYRITTREIQLDVLVPVVAVADASGTGRKWQVDWGRVDRLPSTRLTPLGEGMKQVRQGADAFLLSWKQKLEAGQRTGPPPRDETDWDGVIVSAGGERSAAQVAALARKEVPAVLLGTAAGHVSPGVAPQPACPWESIDGRIRLALSFQVPIQGQPGASLPDYIGQGTLFLETGERVDPLNPGASPTWKVAAYRLDNVLPVPPEEKRPGGAGR